MKTLHKYLVKNYIGPFVLTLFISLFVLVMQFLWKYLEDLVGKGIGFSVLAELFYWVILTMIPLALPLAVLLSSLMTFGNLGEYYELVALKSSGLSLQKIMRPLVIFICIVSIGAFYFSNNVLPYANLKWHSLIYDVTHQKPSINIKEGAFYNGINKFVIRVDKKNEDGKSMEGILIYDHTNTIGNSRVVIAERGKMEMTPDRKYFIINLENGHSYDETKSDGEKKEYHPLLRSDFKTKVIKVALSGFDFVKSDEELFKDNYEMMDISSISRELDSISLDGYERKNLLYSYLKNKKYGLINFQGTPSDSAAIKTAFPNQVINQNTGIPANTVLGKSNTPELTEASKKIAAANIARNAKAEIQRTLHELKIINNPIVYLNIVWHKKFTLSIACLILFFIGAPLGAIIRKGGLGMPVVISVIFFIFYWVISIVGEKFSKEGIIEPYLGMWISTVFFLPIGIILTAKATADSSLFDIEQYKRFLKVFKK